MSLKSERWDNWLTNETNKKVIIAAEEYYEARAKEEGIPDYFTPHDSSHCLAVEKLVKAILKKNNVQLSETESFVLFLCVWTHDIGMFTNVAQRHLGASYSVARKRELHEKISAWFIAYDPAFLCLFTQNGIPEALAFNYINTMSIINKYHRRKNSIDECPEERFIASVLIRARLLASLVRLGDTLHVDSSRYNRKLYNILQIGHFDRTARLHWLKSYVVSSVFLRPELQTIQITIDLPEPEECEKQEWEEGGKKLAFVIREDILEDVIAVEDVFRKHGITCYTQVKVVVDYCQALSESRKKEIEGILNDLHIVLSPSTSNVIRKATDSIVALGEMPFSSYEAFYNQAVQLEEHLTRVYVERPCHVGLGKMRDLLAETLATWKKPTNDAALDEIKTCQKQILQKTREVKKLRGSAIARICAIAPSVLCGVQNLLLFGYSEMVTKFISEKTDRSFKDESHLYVFECSGKRRFSVTNMVEYNDGMHYATALRNSGFKHVTILPDAAIATLCENADRNIRSDNSLMLFGANGIDEDTEDCGHSSGHLAMAIVAEKYRVTVAVVADKFKVGVIDWKPNLTREGLPWLAGERDTVSKLGETGVSLLNYREDRIPRRYIQRIVTEESE